MRYFQTEFKTLNYIIAKAESFILVAHSSPDGDTIGSVLALKKYLESLNKKTDIVCFDKLPNYLQTFTEEKMLFPDQININHYDVLIGCDSVERGYDIIKEKASEKLVTVIIDHHPDITLKSDLVIIDSKASSTCEIIYKYFQFARAKISKSMATYLLTGILGDTGNFQHSNTTTDVLDIASTLMKQGASLPKIVKAAFANKKISTLQLWGKAFHKAKINPKNGMIVTAITRQDIQLLKASTDDISQVASILNTVPETRFSLILYEKEEGTIKASLRSEEYKKVDVSKIAHQFGGGGHKLASGFEIKGQIEETEKGWKII